jgi:hypothetical protein
MHYNTMPLSANVSDSKVMRLTGHASKQMRERHAHFDTAKFSEAVDVRQKLLSGNRG